MLKGHPQTPKTRERISRGLARYRRRRKILAKTEPRDLARLKNSGTVTPALRPLLTIASEESGDIINALGGPAQVTPQQRALVEDLAAAGIALRATLMLFLQGAEGDHAARIGALVSVRRASLVCLGINRVEHEVPSLSDYLASKDAQTPASATNGDTFDAVVEPPENASEGATSSPDSRVGTFRPRDNGGGAGSGSSAVLPRTVAHEGGEPC